MADDPAARRPARARGLSLAAGRRPRAPQHQREPVSRRPTRSSTGWLDALRDGRLAPLSRSRRARAARRARRVPRAAAGPRVLRERLERGAADAAAHLRRRRAVGARCSSRRTRCTRTSPRITGTEIVVTGDRARRLLDRPVDAAEALIAAAATVASCSCAAPTTRPARWSRARRSSGCVAAAADDRRAARRRRGLRRVRALERARARRRRRGRSSSCARTRRCGRSPRSGSGFAVGAAVGDRGAREGRCCRTRCRYPRSSPATIALDFRAEMEHAGRGAGRGARPAVRRALRASPASRVYPVGRELPARARRAATPTSCGSGCSTRGVLVRDFSRWPARRRMPPHHGRHPRRERRVASPHSRRCSG